MTGPQHYREAERLMSRADAPTLADLLAKEEASSPPLEPSERSEHMDRWRADQVAHRAADRLDDWHRAQDKSPTRRTLIKLTRFWPWLQLPRFPTLRRDWPYLTAATSHGPDTA